MSGGALPAPDARLARLADAAAALDRDRVDGLVDGLAADARRGRLDAPQDDVVRALGALRRKRFFAPARALADALLQGGRDAPALRLRYAQALLELGLLAAAHTLLSDLRDAPGADRDEVEGLLGRAHKQMYLDAADPDADAVRGHLHTALGLYGAAYARHPEGCRWHGINAVALARRAARDGVPLPPGAPDPDALAAALLDRIRTLRDACEEAGEELPAWEMATALEAALALGRDRQALLWVERYTAHPDADAFELGSTERQLREVWGLTADSPVLSVLRAGLLQRSDGGVRLEPAELHGPVGALERVLGTAAYQSLRWYERGLTRARAVARVHDADDVSHGTGFLLDSACVADGRFGPGPLLLTNSHVVSEAVRGALPPDAATVRFEATAADGAPAARRVTLLAESPPDALDFALLRLDAPVPEAEPCPPARALPRVDDEQRLYAIGYPRGGPLAFSLQDNVFLGASDTLLHYRTPTDPGSSGSPVFNRQWELVGLHHAGYDRVRRFDGPGFYAANEGVRFDAIARHLATV